MKLKQAGKIVMRLRIEFGKLVSFDFGKVSGE